MLGPFPNALNCLILFSNLNATLLLQNITFVEYMVTAVATFEHVYSQNMTFLGAAKTGPYR